MFFFFAAALVLAAEIADHLVKAGVFPKNGAYLGVFVLLAIVSWTVGRAVPRLVTFRLAYDGEILQYPLDTEASSNNRWRGP
jgi:hypothetical protein